MASLVLPSVAVFSQTLNLLLVWSHALTGLFRPSELNTSLVDEEWRFFLPSVSLVLLVFYGAIVSLVIAKREKPLPRSRYAIMLVLLDLQAMVCDLPHTFGYKY